MSKLIPLLLLILLTGCATTPPWEQTDPDKQALAYANRGMGYLEFDQPIRAMQDFQLALDLRPRHARALHGMALSLQEQGENQLADDYFKKTLQADPHKTAARNNYAAFLFSQSRYDEARTELKKASEDIRYPNRSMIFENLGYVELQLNQQSAATDHFQRAVELNRSAVNSHRELLMLRLDQGQLNRAEQHWHFLRSAGVRDEPTLRAALDLAQKTGNQPEQRYIEDLLKTSANHNQEPAN
ncbi:MAG: tetratricopeptide repeat protein [Marinospirillum sp.]|uniref:tetratricopeptide repeat protein n=1 Tax=Marinospirillum sp. TaxID=2183934 RepID=UPI0019E8FF64|nr:tetratricopeptide repeat protein [Marinospirillum sp.]MBE0505265.1 tetratricopeptide repeat protein [Marinospirillum sp.]